MKHLPTLLLSLVVVPALIACEPESSGSGGDECGDGFIGFNEVCDVDTLGGETCMSQGMGEGTLQCAFGCRKFDTSDCEGGEEPPPEGCGDGEVGDGEVCDGDNLNGASCDTLGLDEGTLRCATNCQRYDPSGCGGGDCEPACGARVCGPDPTCGVSCGVCAEGACNGAGTCDANAEPSAPRFLQFGTNVETLGEGQTVVFSAILTDADGIDDLIGGSLFDADTGATLGTFATAAQEGAYSLRLSWEELNTATSINVGPAGVQRTFRAEFFDQGGLSSRAETAVRLKCRTAGHSACDGECFDLQTDLGNCGRCGRQVDRNGGQAVACRDGMPACSNQDEFFAYCTDRCLDTNFDVDNCGECGKRCNHSDTDFGDCRAREIGGCLGQFITPSRTRCSTHCPASAPGGHCPPYDEPGRALYGPGDSNFIDVACDEVPPASDGNRPFRELHCYCQY